MRLFDKDRDPDAVQGIQTRMNGVLLAVYVLPVGFLLSVVFVVSGIWKFVFTLGFSVAVGYAVSRMVSAIMNAAGDSFGAFIQPKGHASAYAPAYSYEQSLAVRGDIVGAIAAYETAML